MRVCVYKYMYIMLLVVYMYAFVSMLYVNVASFNVSIIQLAYSVKLKAHEHAFIRGIHVIRDSA